MICLFFYALNGGELKEEIRCLYDIEPIKDLLGPEAVKEMFEATQKEWEAKFRRSLCPKDVELYDGYLNGEVKSEEWYKRMYGRMDERTEETTPPASRTRASPCPICH